MVDLEDLKKRACLKLKDGQYMIRPAIRQNLEYCINTFKSQFNGNNSHTEHVNEVLNIESDCFTSTFIKCIMNNMDHSKYRYEYDLSMRRFASSIYALGGRNLYQFLKLNLPYAFPSIPTLESYNNDICLHIEEGEFRFQELKYYSNKINSNLVYVFEDCTGVVSKVSYDTETNSFVGFCPTLNNGLPTIRQYQTNNFSQLEDWFNSVEKSTLINVCTVQHITSTETPSFLLSGFGTNNKVDCISVFNRWLFIYNECLKNKIKVLGFSSDADPKFLKAMRLATG